MIGLSAFPSRLSRIRTVTLGLFAVLAIAAVTSLTEWRAQLISASQSAHDEVRRLEASIAQLRNDQTRLSGADISEFRWRGDRLGEVTARIQGRISELAAENGLEVRSIAPTGTRDLPLSIGVGFRLESETTLDRLVGFLTMIEFEVPVIVVDRATLRRLSRPGIAALQPTLYVQLDLLSPVDAMEEAP